jgi:8-hydroxy-5-deazaflavin:NADPH oxidoreductase
MTTVGLIGSGMIGGTVAQLSVAAGHQVVLSNSRGPETLEELARKLGPLARAGTGAQAAAAGDIVVVSIPLRAYLSVPPGPLAGKTVIDTNNYYPQRDGQIAELNSGEITSSGLLQRHLSGSHVVKAFNNIFYRHLLSLARPPGAADRTFLPIAGDDPAAKDAVIAFLDSIGYGAIDVGSLADSWRQEPGTPVYGPPYGSFSQEAGTPASEDKIRAALAAAAR